MSNQQAVLRIPEVAPELKEVEVVPEAVVAGDHPTVLAMADSLSTMGISVTLIHPYKEIEEIVAHMRGLMEADEEVSKKYAFLCEKVAANKSIKVMSEATVDDVSGWWGNFSVGILQKGTSVTLKTSGIAVAYKGNPMLPEAFSAEGIKSFSDFLAQFDMRKGALKEATNPAKRVAFVLDVDGRDEKWASVTALRFGAYLKGFGSQVYILCRDFKVSVDDMEREYRLAREAGILIFKYRDYPRIEGKRIIFQDTSAVSEKAPLDVVLDDVDAIVIQEKVVPSKGQEEFLGWLKIPQEGGFVGPNNPQFIGRTPKKGVVVAGDTWYPEYPTDGYVTALSAAAELYKWIGRGTYQVDIQRVAEVDPSKCATCLTCYRICPHDSIRIERYGERNVYITKGEKEGATWEAARVKVETCNGCGLCASECPAKAIQLVYYPDLEVLEFLEKT